MINGVLSVTLYNMEGEGDRYRVHLLQDDGKLCEVTEDYEMVSIATHDGREGFGIVPREEGVPEESLTEDQQVELAAQQAEDTDPEGTTYVDPFDQPEKDYL